MPNHSGRTLVIVGFLSLAAVLMGGAVAMADEHSCLRRSGLLPIASRPFRR